MDNPQKKVCPLCGSVLSTERFAKVINAHTGMQRQLQKLRDAERRASESLKLAQARAKRVAQQVRAKSERLLVQERKRAEERMVKHKKSALALRLKIEDLERRLELGETAQSEGLLEERALLEFLQENFPEDRFNHVGKRGDILQAVRTHAGVEVGRIVFEVKRVQQWSSDHLVQCAKAREDREADIAVLVTNRFPARKAHYFVERQVLVISPLAVLPVVHTAREGLLNVHGLKTSEEARKDSVAAVYEYLAGGQYTDHVRQIAQHLTDIESLFHKEVTSHKRVWEDRLKHYRGIVTAVAMVDSRLRRVIASPSGSGVLQMEAAKILPKFTN